MPATITKAPCTCSSCRHLSSIGFKWECMYCGRRFKSEAQGEAHTKSSGPVHVIAKELPRGR